MQYDLEVLAVTRIVDVLTNNPVAQVVLGTANKMTPKVRDRLTDDQQRTQGEIYSKTVVITLPLPEAIRYRVGTKWRLTTDNSGSISLKEITP